MHIAVVTTSRADWGHVEPVLRVLRTRLKTSLLVGGAHLDARFGRTIDAIHEAGYEVADTITFLADEDSDRGMGEGIGRAVQGCDHQYGEQNRPWKNHQQVLINCI